MGCSKCRYSIFGCKQCRNPSFKGNRAPPSPPFASPLPHGALPPHGKTGGSKRTRQGELDEHVVDAPAEGSGPKPQASSLKPIHDHAYEPSRANTPSKRSPHPPPSRLVSTGDPRVSCWTPPPSPYSLIEEFLYNEPWKLLVATILLNKTSAQMVRGILGLLFERWATPHEMRAANEDELSNLLYPLGLFRKRAIALKRMSAEFVDTEWRNPQELHMCGRYASDAYFIFCRGQWREMADDFPEDKDLKLYYDFLVATDGQGTGLEREEGLLRVNPLPAASPCSPVQPLYSKEHETSKSTLTEERRARLKSLLSPTVWSSPRSSDVRGDSRQLVTPPSLLFREGDLPDRED